MRKSIATLILTGLLGTGCAHQSNPDTAATRSQTSAQSGVSGHDILR